MTAFASAADMIARFDSRTLGDLCSDDGSRISEAVLSAGSDPKMTAALDSATGAIKAAALRAGRYTTAQLEALTGEGLAYLKDLTCAIAFELLWRRKPYSDDENRQYAKEMYKEALEMIRSGDHIFDVDVVAEAGKPQVDTVPRDEIVNQWGLVPDRARGRFFPRRRSYRNR